MDAARWSPVAGHSPHCRFVLIMLQYKVFPFIAGFSGSPLEDYSI